MSSSIETRCVHGEKHKFSDSYQSLSMPIYQTAAFGHPDLGHSPERFYYTRLTNPTRLQAEETVSSLEGATDTVAFTSGMAAITAVFELFAPVTGSSARRTSTAARCCCSTWWRRKTA